MSEFEKLNWISIETNTNFFCIQSYDGLLNRLLLIGSDDLSYYHCVEVEFTGVTYLTLPTDFSYPFFRLATIEEKKTINKTVALSEKDVVYCIEAETSSSLEKLLFYLVAVEVKVREGIVYHYERERLKEGESIAPWIKRS